MKFDLKTFGKGLVMLSALGFIASAILSFTIYSGLDRGAIPAISMLFVMVGMCFVWPDLLTGTDGGVSTMRVVVFSVVMVFVVIYTKIGWNASFDEFKIDSTWISILGLAFGAKAAQHFSETNQAAQQNQTTPQNQTAQPNPAAVPMQNISTGGQEPVLNQNTAVG